MSKNNNWILYLLCIGVGIGIGYFMFHTKYTPPAEIRKQTEQVKEQKKQTQDSAIKESKSNVVKAAKIKPKPVKVVIKDTTKDYRKEYIKNYKPTE